ncbi:MAG: hypothetical protein K0B15_11850 [Lentimicrobium sp.]|nr:hypothetical protein [Lentimicrobium sp.]
MKKNKIKYEQHLNNVYAAIDVDSVVEQLFYLTDQERYRFCSVADIIEAHRKQTVGLLLRRYDSKQFHEDFERWLKE